ncbi:MAG: hypothetical protein ACM3PP_06735 [Candidatus Saccharibacteria bacterium]
MQALINLIAKMMNTARDALNVQVTGSNVADGTTGNAASYVEDGNGYPLQRMALDGDYLPNEGFRYIDISSLYSALDTSQSTKYVRSICMDDEGILYAIIGKEMLYSSKDNGETWTAETSINTDGTGRTERDLHYVAVTDVGTVLVFGVRVVNSVSKMSVWRKPKGSSTYTRIDIYDRTANSERVASVSCGKMGLFFTAYITSLVWRSQDDGLTWTSYTFTSAQFLSHVHCVWASPWDTAVYVSGGDDAWGKGGVFKSTDFSNWTLIFTEVPGERIVPITGNQRKRFFGIEHPSGGALSTYDDAEYQMIFGRKNLGWMNFDCLLATPDGLLIAGMYAYANYTGQLGHGGEIYVSQDDGASFQCIRTGYSLISSIVNTDRYIFVAFGYGGGGYITHSGCQKILRIDKRCLFGTMENKVTKIVLQSTSEITTRTLTNNSVTKTVDMTPYTKVACLIIPDSTGGGTLTIQGITHERVAGEARDVDRWVTLSTVTLDTAGAPSIVELSAGAELFPIYRVKNLSGSNVIVKQIAFLGSLA